MALNSLASMHLVAAPVPLGDGACGWWSALVAGGVIDTGAFAGGSPLANRGEPWAEVLVDQLVTAKNFVAAYLADPAQSHMLRSEFELWIRPPKRTRGADGTVRFSAGAFNHAAVHAHGGDGDLGKWATCAQLRGLAQYLHEEGRVRNCKIVVLPEQLEVAAQIRRLQIYSANSEEVFEIAAADDVVARLIAGEAGLIAITWDGFAGPTGTGTGGFHFNGTVRAPSAESSVSGAEQLVSEADQPVS